MYLFVACEHPNFDASIGKVLDALRDPLLQLIFNGSAAQQSQVDLDLLSHHCQLLISVH